MSTLNKLIIICDNNVQSLTIEIYKYLHGLSATILDEVFKVNEAIPKTARYGTEHISLVFKDLGFDFTKY